jgi:6,7-dimethyl-8-ribityllumazine synthase
MNLIEGKLKVVNGKKIAIVSTRWNHFIVDRLVEGAKDAFFRHGGNEADLTHILAPGAFDLPMVVDRLLSSGKYDAVCALGAVIRGSTPHFEYVSSEVAKGVNKAAFDTDVPIIFGVLTTDTIEQAIERAGTKAGNKGAEVAMGALEYVNLLNKEVK